MSAVTSSTMAFPEAMQGATVTRDGVVVLARWSGPAEVRLLHAEERALVGDPRPARVWSFCAGRLAARAALGALGAPDLPVLRDRRVPLWPAGVVGSIAHTSSSAVAVVAWRADIAGVGIDIETAAAVDEELWASVLGARERAWVETCGLRARDAATLVFSAKESVFKAQFPTTGRWLEFDEVEICVDEPTRRFAASLDQISGCYGWDGDEVWTLALCEELTPR